MNTIWKSPHIEIRKTRKACYICDRRTGDEYKVSEQDYALIRQVSEPTSYEAIIGSCEGISTEVALFVQLTRLVQLGAIYTDLFEDVLPNSPFVAPSGPRMFGAPSEFENQGESARIVFVGLPWDFGYGYKGAALGPEVLRATSQAYTITRSSQQGNLLGWHSYDLGRDVLADVELVDLGNVKAPVITDYDGVQPAIRKALAEVRLLNAFPVFVGGDHGLTLCLLRALTQKPVVFLQLDAHDDFYDFQDCGHGTFMKNVAQLPNIEAIYMAGIRGIVPAGRGDTLKTHGIKTLTAAQWHRHGHSQLLARLPDLPIFISLDVDILDPAFAPATHALRGGGITPAQVIDLLLDLVNMRSIIGLDIMELSMPRYSHDITAHYIVEILLHFLDALMNSTLQTPARLTS